jgi:hypothetical protein
MSIHVPAQRYALSFFFVRFVFFVVNFFLAFLPRPESGRRVGLDARTPATTPEDVGQDPRYK